jgi:hypothetical protein
LIETKTKNSAGGFTYLSSLNERDRVRDNSKVATPREQGLIDAGHLSDDDDGEKKKEQTNNLTLDG